MIDPTGSAEQPKLGGVLFSVMKQPCLDIFPSLPVGEMCFFFNVFFQVYVTGGAVFFFLWGGVEANVWVILPCRTETH